MLTSLAQILEIIDELNPLHAKKIRNNSRLFDDEYDTVFAPMLEKFMKVLNDDSHDLRYAVECYLHMIAGITLEQINFIRNDCYSNASYMEVEKRVFADKEKLKSFKLALLISELLWPQHFLIYLRFIHLFKQYGDKTEKFVDIGGSHGQYLSYVFNRYLTEKPVLIYTNPLSADMVQWFVSPSGFEIIDEKSIRETIREYDWVTMGETLEHTENPAQYVDIALRLLSKEGYLFVTAPVNAPAIDHVYCFRSKEEVLSMFRDKGLTLVDELQVFAEESQKLRHGAASVCSALFRKV
jgi:hypothetical protein